jgi:hypothetical protein
MGFLQAEKSFKALNAYRSCLRLFISLRYLLVTEKRPDAYAAKASVP